ncbi:TIGR02679 family protein [Streptomyces sp. NBC_01016]|uniref:TIGR02679 family protein n=1 Tax=Streptomyces sp. NBC_01016 TaxID=2903720 RepID=UPI002B1CFF5E|nr:TIGR02679 family protein [Streptomyces sp. NBC_01016]
MGLSEQPRHQQGQELGPESSFSAPPGPTWAAPAPDGQAAPPVDGPRLRRLLGDPDLAWLLDRARRRLERDELLTGSVSLTAPTPAQQAAAERLLGRPPRVGGRSLSVRLDVVDALLRRSGASPGGLAPAVVALTGAVTSLAATRMREERAWRSAYGPLDDLVAAAGAPTELRSWTEQLPRSGLVRRLSGDPDTARALVADAVQALRHLPAAPPVSLPAYAARVLGSAHALDDGTPLATLVLSGVRALTGFPDGSGSRWRREAWASAGLLRDDLSSTVLTLNLRGTPALDWLADTGEPAVLTLRQLARGHHIEVAGPVYICENPAVLSAAAEEYGPFCPPLVCLQGQPSTAALTLLAGMRTEDPDPDVGFRYHGDFDWGGLRIAATLARHIAWRPWRYTAADYRRAATGLTGAELLTGAPAAAPWDPELPGALAEMGVRVEEEAVLDELLADLAPGKASR